MREAKLGKLCKVLGSPVQDRDGQTADSTDPLRLQGWYKCKEGENKRPEFGQYGEEKANGRSSCLQ